MRLVDVFRHVRELQEIADMSNGRVDDGKDSSEESMLIHAR